MAKQRLIDANALESNLKSALNFSSATSYLRTLQSLEKTDLVKIMLDLIGNAPTVKPKTIKTTESYRDEKYIFNGECNLDELYDTREKYIFNGECDHSEHKDYPFESMGS